MKHYSYFLVPYIVAENPDLTARQAIGLSRRMMRGHKWECFVFELSFIGWDVLGILTLGLSDVLFTDPYKMACFTRYYARAAGPGHPERPAGREAFGRRLSL